MAEQLMLEDERVKNSGMFYSNEVAGHKEGYFESIEDFKEFAVNEDIKLTSMNNKLWICKEEVFDIDVENILENECEDHYEDAYDHLIDIDELEEFVSNWCKKQRVKTYYESNKYYILISLEDVEE